MRTFFPAPGIARAVACAAALACLPLRPGTAAPKRAPVSFAIYHFTQAECQADQTRPVRIESLPPAPDGTRTYRFTDKRTQKTFRDGQAITSDFTRLAASPPRPGTQTVPVPAPFQAATPRKTLSLTPPQRATLASLTAEMRAWHGFLSRSPRLVTSADLARPATVLPRGPGQFTVQLTLTPAARKTFTAFTGTHVNEIIGFVLAPDTPHSQLHMAPNINEAITGPTVEFFPLPTHRAAQALATRINHTPPR